MINSTCLIPNVRCKVIIEHERIYLKFSIHFCENSIMHRDGHNMSGTGLDAQDFIIYVHLNLATNYSLILFDNYIIQFFSNFTISFIYLSFKNYWSKANLQKPIFLSSSCMFFYFINVITRHLGSSAWDRPVQIVPWIIMC